MVTRIIYDIMFNKDRYLMISTFSETATQDLYYTRNGTRILTLSKKIENNGKRFWIGIYKGTLIKIEMGYHAKRLLTMYYIATKRIDANGKLYTVNQKS